MRTRISPGFNWGIGLFSSTASWYTGPDLAVEVALFRVMTLVISGKLCFLAFIASRRPQSGGLGRGANGHDSEHLLSTLMTFTFTHLVTFLSSSLNLTFDFPLRRTSNSLQSACTECARTGILRHLRASYALTIDWIMAMGVLYIPFIRKNREKQSVSKVD